VNDSDTILGLLSELVLGKENKSRKQSENNDWLNSLCSTLKSEWQKTQETWQIPQTAIAFDCRNHNPSHHEFGTESGQEHHQYWLTKTCPCTLSLFQSFVWSCGGSTPPKPIMCQPNVNGKRFSKLQKITHATNTHFVAVPYKANHRPFHRDETSNSSCRILPMTLSDTIDSQSKLGSYASPIDSDDVVKTYTMVFGADIDSDFHGLLNGARKRAREKGIDGDGYILALLTSRLIQQLHLEFKKSQNQDDVYGKLLLSLAQYTWGEEDAHSKLDHLKIPPTMVEPLTLIAFAFRVPIKLGYLVGESIIPAYVKMILERRELIGDEFEFEATIYILQHAPGGFLQMQDLKQISNRMLEETQNACVPGSLFDFICEAAAEKCECKESESITEYHGNDGYKEKLIEDQKSAWEKFLIASCYNPHLMKIRSDYESNGGKQLDEEEEGVLKTLERASWNQHAEKNTPKAIIWVLTFLTQFCDTSSAKALLQFLMEVSHCMCIIFHPSLQ